MTQVRIFSAFRESELQEYINNYCKCCDEKIIDIKFIINPQSALKYYAMIIMEK